jgi:subtilase family serine protease
VTKPPLRYLISAAACASALLLVAGTSPAMAGGASAARKLPTMHLPGFDALASIAAAPPTTAQCEATYHIACYSPNQLETAYNTAPLYKTGTNGKGQTIIIVDSYGSPTIAADLKTFDAGFHLQAPPSLKIIAPAGKIPPYDPSNATMVSWAGETTLDVEYSHAMAPDANILLVETPVAETEGSVGFPQIVKAEEYVIDHHMGGVISQSLAATEETFSSTTQIMGLRGAYKDALKNHVTVLGATGDNGATNQHFNGTLYTKPVVAWPATDPLVTAVGGTELHLNASGIATSPANVWDDSYNKTVNNLFFGSPTPHAIASGGGVSAVFSRPSYQNGVKGQVGSWRGVPDVDMSGACSGTVITYGSFGGQPAGYGLVCGTSEATPLFAGIVALADQMAGHPLGLINPALYSLSEMHAKGIVPVTKGSNTVSFTQSGTYYTIKGEKAAPVYSTSSGVGTVNAALFVPELVAAAGK